MKKIIITVIVVLSFITCNKNKKTTAPTVVYCMSTNDGGHYVKQGCASTKEEMQNKAIQLRNAGYVTFNSVEKSSCSDCN